MSGFREAMRRSQRLSVAAKEEQHRLGHPEIHVEHLLLALLIVGRESGRALVSAGLTVDSARRAVETHHRSQLGSLGIDAPALEPGPVPDTAWNRTEWAEPALEALSRADLRDGDGGVLLALLDEASGRVPAILDSAGVDTGALRAAVPSAAVPSAAVDGGAAPGAASPHRGVRAHVEEFVNAPVVEVWALIADPLRRPDWDGEFVAEVEQHADGAFTTTSPTHRPDGRRMRIRPDRRRILHTPTRFEPPTAVTWSMTLPDRPATDRVWRRSVVLEADGAGTRIRLDEEISRPRRVGPVRGPLLRFLIRQGLAARAAAIDRILR